MKYTIRSHLTLLFISVLIYLIAAEGLRLFFAFVRTDRQSAGNPSSYIKMHLEGKQ